VFKECIEEMKNVGQGVATTNRADARCAPKSGSWECDTCQCDTCLVQNEEQANQYVACMWIS